MYLLVSLPLLFVFPTVERLQVLPIAVIQSTCVCVCVCVCIVCVVLCVLVLCACCVCVCARVCVCYVLCARVQVRWGVGAESGWVGKGKVQVQPIQ